MRVFAMWHGGDEYPFPVIPEDVEVFGSLAEATEEFASRTQGRARYTYVDGRTVNTDTPVVSHDMAADGGPTMTIWHFDPRDEPDPYPDRIISYGPKGGVKIERV